MTQEQVKVFEKRFLREFIGILISVVALMFGGYFLAYWITNSHPEGPGTFGDLFGVTTTLFSGWAFAGLWYTIRIQRLELQITREELTKTATANEASAKANEAAARISQAGLEVQRLSTIIAGREAILQVLIGSNEAMARAVWKPSSGDYSSPKEMATIYADKIVKALNRLDEIRITS